MGDSANNLSYAFVISFFAYYCTDVFKISAAAVGLILLVPRLFDAVFDPFVGGLADRTRSKWGSYRPWILFGAIPLAILNILCFAPVPIASEGGRVVYMSIIFVLFICTYSCVNIPYSAMTTNLTQDANERVSLTTFRLVAVILTSILLISLATLPLV
ncbi:MFS transporter, partial [Neobacillus drentensis]|uniref:MFS transporter n=1 Tax=Neobacillus drentensis TaxID=220684 RepID=UPI003B586EE4